MYEKEPLCDSVQKKLADRLYIPDKMYYICVNVRIMKKKDKHHYSQSTQKENDVVNDYVTPYLPQSHNDQLYDILFDKHVSPSSDFDWLMLSRAGISKQVILSLAKRMSLTIQEIAAVMHISERTLQRYDDQDIIKPEYTSRAVELVRLYIRGEEVFGSLDAFKSWMKSPNYIFNNETPLQLLDTPIGFRLVWDEIGRIEHGIFV